MCHEMRTMLFHFILFPEKFAAELEDAATEGQSRSPLYRHPTCDSLSARNDVLDLMRYCHSFSSIRKWHIFAKMIRTFRSERFDPN